MHVTDTQNFAIQAKIASLLGPEIYDHLFASMNFTEIDEDVLFAYVDSVAKADEIESMYCFEISAAAEQVLNLKSSS